MTTAQRESIVQRVGRILDERISVARWFTQNACMRHGLPLPDAGEVRLVIESQQQADPPKQPTAEEIAAAVAARIPAPSPGPVGPAGPPGPSGRWKS
jgi:hypothetical protein